jgi:hypothetical protein
MQEIRVTARCAVRCSSLIREVLGMVPTSTITARCAGEIVTSELRAAISRGSNDWVAPLPSGSGAPLTLRERRSATFTTVSGCNGHSRLQASRQVLSHLRRWFCPRAVTHQRPLRWCGNRLIDPKDVWLQRSSRSMLRTWDVSSLRGLKSGLFLAPFVLDPQ